MNETMGMSYASLYYAEVGKNNELQKENKKLKELCDKYEEEHKTTFIEWQKDINILKEIKQWLEVNDRYSQGYFKQVLEYINILKGSDKE